MNILIVGGTGYIGSHIVEQLLENTTFRLYIASRDPSKSALKYAERSDNKRITWVKFDYSNFTTALDFLECIDVIINAAGILYETRSMRYEQIHFKGPTALISHFVKANKRKKLFINISMKDAEMQSAQGIPFVATKNRADKKMLELAKEDKNLITYILRPSVVYGNYSSKEEMSRHAFPSYAAIPIMFLIGGFGLRLGNFKIGKQGGKQAMHPIQAKEIGQIVAAIVNKASHNKPGIYKLVGPRITAVDLFSNLRISMGLKSNTFLSISVPTIFAKLGASIVDLTLSIFSKLDLKTK